MDISDKVKHEQALISEMIALYCKLNKHEKENGQFCPQCYELNTYAKGRLAKCPHMATKSFCSKCETPCYSPDMKERIRAVMRYSGPKMLFYHPILLVKHMVAGKRNA